MLKSVLFVLIGFLGLFAGVLLAYISTEELKMINKSKYFNLIIYCLILVLLIINLIFSFSIFSLVFFILSLYLIYNYKTDSFKYIFILSPSLILISRMKEVNTAIISMIGIFLGLILAYHHLGKALPRPKYVFQNLFLNYWSYLLVGFLFSLIFW